MKTETVVENGKTYLVRINSYGSKAWYLGDKLHREDGPAIEYADGSKYYWLNDEPYTYEEWKAKANEIRSNASKQPLNTESNCNFINKTNLKFKDISSEAYRIYTWADGSKFKIEEPLKLHVSESGAHRIFSNSGNSYYIAPGWIAIEWQAKPGQANFVA